MHLPVQSKVRRRCRRLWPVLLLTLSWASVAVTHTEACHAQSDVETEEARRRFQEGVRYYDQRQYDKARLAFTQAYALKPHPAVLLNLAQSELRAGHYAAAATHFAQYIRENPNADAMDHARGAFEEARKRVVEVNVAVNQPDAVISVDGIEAGKSPLPDVLYVEPGARTIGAEKDGAQASHLLRAEAGQRLYVTLELQAPWSAAAPAAAPGTAGVVPAPPAATEPVSAESGESPGFFEWLGNTPEAIATVTVGGLALGSSAVLAAFASKRYDDANEVKDAIMTQLRSDIADNLILEPATPCGPGGIANGVVNFPENIDEERPGFRERRIEDYRRACDSFTQRADSGDRLKTFAFVALGVGAAATVATVVWYFTDTAGSSGTASGARRPAGKRKSSSGERDNALLVVPIVSQETQGLFLQYSF
jgi:tetratricopeptide (TPR) repeat protein